MGPQTTYKEHEKAHMCSSQGEESPGEASEEDEAEQAENNLLSCGMENKFVYYVCYISRACVIRKPLWLFLFNGHTKHLPVD